MSSPVMDIDYTRRPTSQSRKGCDISLAYPNSGCLTVVSRFHFAHLWNAYALFLHIDICLHTDAYAAEATSSV